MKMLIVWLALFGLVVPVFAAPPGPAEKDPFAESRQWTPEKRGAKPYVPHSLGSLAEFYDYYDDEVNPARVTLLREDLTASGSWTPTEVKFIVESVTRRDLDRFFECEVQPGEQLKNMLGTAGSVATVEVAGAPARGFCLSVPTGKKGKMAKMLVAPAVCTNIAECPSRYGLFENVEGKHKKTALEKEEERRAATASKNQRKGSGRKWVIGFTLGGLAVGGFAVLHGGGHHAPSSLSPATTIPVKPVGDPGSGPR